MPEGRHKACGRSCSRSRSWAGSRFSAMARCCSWPFSPRSTSRHGGPGARTRCRGGLRPLGLGLRRRTDRRPALLRHPILGRGFTPSAISSGSGRAGSSSTGASSGERPHSSSTGWSVRFRCVRCSTSSRLRSPSGTAIGTARLLLERLLLRRSL